MFTFELSTFVFQAVNFLILLLVLSRFLYRPLLKVMNEREMEVAVRLREAEERQARADAERQELAHTLDAARQEATEIVTRARVEASRQAEELLTRARQQARETSDAALRRLQIEEDAVRHRLDRAVHETAVDVAGSLIRRAAGPSVHQALLERALNDALRLDEVPSEAIGGTPSNGHRLVRWELAYPPDPDVEARLRRAVARTFGQSPEDVELRVEPALIAGWRLIVDTWSLDLSLRRTLEDLRDGDTRPPNGGYRDAGA